MALVIHLLGAPRVERDGGEQQAPRGHKAWGLLTYLLLTRQPIGRATLCSLLFADAEDPLAALRWNLSVLRRLLGDASYLRGDPLMLSLSPADRVDVRAVTAGTWPQVASLGDVGHELLEGMSFASSPSYEVWLETERRHVRGALEGQLHEASLTSLAAGEGARAADLAGRLVRLSPYDENYQSLLVRALAAAGDGVGAARQVAACRALFQRELGIEPGPALGAAAATLTARPVTAAATGRAGTIAQLEAGEAAIAAGAVEAGLQCLRRALADAEELAAEDLQVRALAALGTALVHAVRGRDEEGATALHRALAIAADRFPTVAAEVSRELGYVEFLRARYDRVEPWLVRAEAAAGDDQAVRARVLTVRGSVLTDVGRYAPAMAALSAAVALTTDERHRSYTLSMLGRAHLLRGELVEAGELLDRSLELAVSQGWTSFVPWPESLRAAVDLEKGDLDPAAERLEHAFALGCHVGDPCWEGIAGRGLGLLQARRGDIDGAVQTLQDARARSTRMPDGYLWLDAYTLEAMCALAVAHGLAQAAGWVRELGDIAGRTGMRELAARALLHRVGLGEESVVQAAADLARQVDNPALAAALLPTA